MHRKHTRSFLRIQIDLVFVFMLPYILAWLAHFNWCLLLLIAYIFFIEFMDPLSALCPNKRFMSVISGQ